MMIGLLPSPIPDLLPDGTLRGAPREIHIKELPTGATSIFEEYEAQASRLLALMLFVPRVALVPVDPAQLHEQAAT